MNGRLKGQHPRPRVALLGKFDGKDRETFEAMFPTVWKADTLENLCAQVDHRDVDLLIIGEGIEIKSKWDYMTHCHVVSFSEDRGLLPGPCDGVLLVANAQAKTTEFRLPDLPLPMSRMLDGDIGHLRSVRGWKSLDVVNDGVFMGSSDRNPVTEAREKLLAAAIVVEEVTGAPLACLELTRFRGHLKT